MIDFAVDLETLGRHAGCVVLSIGAVAFEPSGKGITEDFYLELQIDEQLREGFKVEAATLRWWSEQENRDVLSGDDEGRREPLWAYSDFCVFVAKLFMYKLADESTRVWCVGTDFDVAMLRWMCDHFKFKWPFGYQAARDVRTFCDAMGFDRKSFKAEDSMRPHHALDDAKYVAALVQEVYRQSDLRNL